MKQETSNKLNSIENLGQYLNFLNENFDTKACKIGHIVKSTILYLLAQKSPTNALVIENAKNKALQANTVFEFIEVVKNNLNLNTVFTLSAKQNLKADTDKLILITLLKEKNYTITESKPLTEIESKPITESKPIRKKK